MTPSLPRRLPERPGRELRIILLLGFGGLLAMLLAAGLEALSTLRSLHAQEQAARQDFLARSQCLLEFRSTLDVYGSRIDEYFLEDSDIQSGAARDFVALSRRIHANLQAYPATRSSEENQLLDAIRKSLSDQQAALNAVMSEDQHDNPEKISRMLYQQVMPRNRSLIQATERVESWNHRQLTNAGTMIIESFDRLQSRLMKLLLVVLGSGLLLSLGSIIYILHQDQEARRRYAELTESRDALERLPSRLLDAQEEERRSISRELHDEVGQSLGALLVDLGRLKAAIPPDDAVAQEQLGRIKSTAESAVNAIRNLALVLRPSMLDDLGLIPAIEWQAREVSRRTEMEAEVEASSVPEDLPEDYKICIYRITQEALNNASRHSGGRHAWVKVEQNAGRIVVTVRDDGRGFDTAKTRGLGILGMEERVRRLGGTLDIRSKEGVGTAVRADLPRPKKR